MPVPKIAKPHELRHPNYLANQENWRKWRLAYEGGDRFIRQYLRRFSKRESDTDFADRKAMTYNPGFAKAAINEVKYALTQRLTDVTRDGGSDSYMQATEGLNQGVDMLGNSMSSFIARRILPELLVMQRVGIYVDMPSLDGTSKAAAKNKRPYTYWYRAEDICSWELKCSDTPNEFTAVLLADTQVEDDPDAFLPTADIRRYRHLWIADDGYVWCQYYDLVGDDYLPDQFQEGPIRLDIKRIPFVMLELPESLMMDAANYQIALLNMASSDVHGCVKANFPLYVEQYDPRTEATNLKKEAPNQYFEQTTAFDPTKGTTHIVNQENVNSVTLGQSSGRRYALNTNQPAFIHPSSEPMVASMKKQDQMKAEIRQLINLAISSLTANTNGASELGFDTQTLESGLAFIGLELEIAERKIAEFWAMYEGGKQVASVNYPENYSLVSQEDRIKAAGEYLELMPKLPSKTYQREMAKRACRALLENKVSQATLAKMLKEIDDAEVISTDPEVIASDFEAGFVGLETASAARGYPKGEVAKAKKDHADRVATIAISQAEGGGAGAPAKGDQGQARGTPDLGADGAAGKKEKKESLDTTTDSTVTDKQRGEAK